MNDRIENSHRISNRAAHLAEEAREAFRRHKRASRESIEAYLEAGNALVEAREECRRGQFGCILARAGIEERTAQRMMRLARSGMKPDTVSAIGGIRAALECIANMEYALVTWQECFDGASNDRARGALLRARPDGPISAGEWLDFVAERVLAA